MSSYAYVYVWDITTFRENYKYIYVQLKKKTINWFWIAYGIFLLLIHRNLYHTELKKEHKMSISKIIKTDCMHSSRFLTLNKHASCVQTSPSTVAMGKGKAMTLNRVMKPLCVKSLSGAYMYFFSSNGKDRLKLNLLSAYG